MSKLISFMLGALFLASCGEHTELEQPIVNDGETIAVTKEIQISVLPMQRVGGASTRSASDKPEEGEAVTMTYHDAATTRAADENMSAAESKINNAYIVQFNGTSPSSTAAWVSGDVSSQLSSGAAITCSFVMTANVANRVYVIANRATAPTKNMTLAAFEAPVALAPATGIPATGLPMSAMQEIRTDGVFDVFQLKSVLAKLTFTCPTASAVLKLKGLPNGYSFYSPEPADAAVRTTGATYSNGGHTFTKGTTYYVPENLSGRNIMINKHSQRALGLAPANSMYMEITYGSTVYNLLLGDGSALDFNFAGGTIYNIEAALAGTSLSDMRVGNPITSTPIDLNATGETANCYIVGTNKWYTFNHTMKGNGVATPLPSNMSSSSVAEAITYIKNTPVITYAEVMWETANTTTAPAKGAVVNNKIYYLKDRILFQTGGVEGNAVIAARNDLNHLIKVWSWHIWCTNTDPTATPQTLATLTSTSGAFEATGTTTLSGLKIMDRNLGALSAAPQSDLSTGLLYQWGRKDPFTGGATLNSNAAMAATNPHHFVTSIGIDVTPSTTSSYPTTFYTSDGDWQRRRDDNVWGTPLTSTVVINNGADNTFNSNRGSKTIYDPCPVGWRVPPEYAFAKVSNKNGGNYSKGRSFSILTSGSSWFPASGARLPASGALELMSLYGGCWSSSPNSAKSANASNMTFSNVGGSGPQSSNNRANGLSVRCAQE